jgi:hypothetical protein
MKKINEQEIEDSIKKSGWFYFGEKKFECHGIHMKNTEFYITNNKLPFPCDKCYKALIFWDGQYSKENLKNFFKMISSFKVNYLGKLNEGVVVFYFRDKNKMINFHDFLQNKMQEFNVEGKIQWRRACKSWQEKKPELWINAKEFIPDIKIVKKIK